MSSEIGFKICQVAAVIKKYKSIIKKKDKEHDKMVLLATYELNNIRVLISIIIHDEFVLINNVLKEFDDIKEEIKNLKT